MELLCYCNICRAGIRGHNEHELLQLFILWRIPHGLQWHEYTSELKFIPKLPVTDTASIGFTHFGDKSDALTKGLWLPCLKVR